MDLKQRNIDFMGKADRAIEGIFDSAYFWDVDMGKIYLYGDAGFVMDRILRWANFPDALEQLEKHYPVEAIREAAIGHRDIRSNEIFDILSRRYRISEDEFSYHRSY